ncbi:hypothetical protein QQG74_23075 [Micromonospora sp. FIMYZ51]|uniref:hypothetical protein n=1 Tax=Micromonospora sp. FIMYZ51 TaxID=3051832 RepID=UPI00311E2DB5
MSIRRLIPVVAGLAVVLAGCTGPGAPKAVPLLRPAWQSTVLPAPPGDADRTMVRDAVTCAGRWYAVGGVADAAGRSGPAAWASPDGREWTVLATVPSSFHGRRHVLYAVACRDGRLVALGAASGGAHGNPRTATWSQGSDGVLREVAAPVGLYGGERAVSVSRLAAGPGGWLLVGNRVAGAAVWTAPDGEHFTLHEGLPELASDGRGRTLAYDAVAVPSGWLAVGVVLAAGVSPVAWTSPDARVWRRLALPGADGRGQAQRVTRTSGGAVLVVGPVSGGFGVWRWAGAEGRWVGSFGGGGAVAPSVRSLAASGDRVVAATADAGGHRLWFSPDAGDSWRFVMLPVEVPSGGDGGLAVAVQEDQLVMLTDPGNGSRAWWGALPAGS